MKPLKTLFFVSLMLVGSHGVAADVNGGYVQQGATSCSNYLKELKEDSWAHVAHGYWISGYFTAYNRQTPNTYDILGSSDGGGAVWWIKNYCEKQPLRNMGDALQELTIELYPTRTIKAPK
jgi:hypothetical protein